MVTKHRLRERVVRQRRIAAVLTAGAAIFVAFVIVGDHRRDLQSGSEASVVNLPSYSHTAAVTGSVIVLALCVFVLLGLALVWWRRRPKG